MEDHVPEDWNPDPKLMSKIVDLNYALFAQGPDHVISTGTSNDKFSVEFCIFVIFVLFNHGRVLKFREPSRY